MKKFCLILLSVLLTASLLCACGGSKSIVGKWAFGVNTYEFKEDKTVSISINGALNYDGTYEINGDKVIVTITDMIGMEKKAELTYALKGNTLTLTGNVTFTGSSVTLDFTKVK